MKSGRWREILESVYYVSQLVGVVAIVVSVLYLAKQVETGNDLNQTNTFRSIFQGLASFSNDVFGHENAELMVKGFRDFEALSPAERMNFDLSMSNFLNYIQDSYESVQVELLDASNREAWSWWLRNRVFPYQGARDWWVQGRELWPEEFRVWVDEKSESANTENDIYGINEIE